MKHLLPLLLLSFGTVLAADKPNIIYILTDDLGWADVGWHGLQVSVVRPWAQYGLPLDERTLPQTLSEAGYSTHISGKWHLGHFQPAYLPMRRGSDTQYGHYNGAIDFFTHARDGGHDWHRNDQESHDQGYATTLLGDEAVRVIEQKHDEKPFFLYLTRLCRHHRSI
jgi:arylsulfatase A-like enzyme